MQLFCALIMRFTLLAQLSSHLSCSLSHTIEAISTAPKPDLFQFRSSVIGSAASQDKLKIESNAVISGIAVAFRIDQKKETCFPLGVQKHCAAEIGRHKAMCLRMKRAHIFGLTTGHAYNCGI